MSIPMSKLKYMLLLVHAVVDLRRGGVLVGALSVERRPPNMSLEDIDECLRWMKEGRAIRVRWKSGRTLWTCFDCEIGKPVAADTEAITLSGNATQERRHISNTHQDQSSTSVMLEHRVTPDA
jgi:hypothetical protein